jgi:hypothetical protein
MFSSGLTVASFMDRNCKMRASKSLNLMSIRTLESQTSTVVKLIYGKFSIRTCCNLERFSKKEKKKEI